MYVLYLHASMTSAIVYIINSVISMSALKDFKTKKKDFYDDLSPFYYDFIKKSVDDGDQQMEITRLILLLF